MKMALYFLLTTCLVGFAVAEVPSYIKLCGRRDPKLDECVINSVENLRETLAAGIPSLDVPPVEPLNIDEIVLADENNFKAKAQNVKFFGFPKFEVKSLHIDFEKRRIDTEIFFKTIRLEAEYDVLTKVGPALIGGQGPIKIDTDEVEAKVTLLFKLVNHKGKKYMFFPSMTTKLNIKDYTSHFTPREGADGALAQGINAALSTDRQGIIATITPNVEKSISTIVLRMANKICENFTFDELFPEPK